MPTSVEPATRRVTVLPGEGLTGTIELIDGESYLEVDQDGRPIVGVSGNISDAGERVQLAATSMIRIRAGNAGAVQVSINGINIGRMGANGAVVEWRIAPAGD